MRWFHGVKRSSLATADTTATIPLIRSGDWQYAQPMTGPSHPPDRSREPELTLMRVGRASARASDGSGPGSRIDFLPPWLELLHPCHSGPRAFGRFDHCAGLPSCPLTARPVCSATASSLQDFTICVRDAALSGVPGIQLAG